MGRELQAAFERRARAFHRHVAARVTVPDVRCCHAVYFAKLMTKAAAVLDGTWSWRSAVYAHAIGASPFAALHGPHPPATVTLPNNHLVISWRNVCNI